MRHFLLLALAFAIAGSWVSVAAAQAEEQLPGTMLISQSDVGDTFDFELNCSGDGSGTVSYHVTGASINSLYDRFEESGTITFDSAGSVTAFDAQFTITADDGRVITGTKTLAEPEAGIGSGACLNDPPGSCSTWAAGAPFTYEATYADGTERGTGVIFSLSATQDQCGGPTSGAFEEDFLATEVAPPVPTTLTLAPSTAVNPLGEPHTITATLVDQYGEPIRDYSVLVTLSGADTGTGRCVTDVLGQCQYTFAAPDFPGDVRISACSDALGDGSCEPDSAVGTATKTYVLPASTAGSSSGDGRIGAVKFAFAAKSEVGKLTASCRIVTATVMAKCLDVTAYVQSGNSATFYGHATVDGVETLYRIQVIDASKSGAGDVFNFATASGFRVGGTLTNGNLKVE